MDPVVRKVALTQLLEMSPRQLFEWADALDLAPPVPPPFAGTDVASAPMALAALARELAPLRVEFDEAQWADMGALLRDGVEPAEAARRIRG